MHLAAKQGGRGPPPALSRPYRRPCARYRSSAPPRCSQETQRMFVRRLEERGWEGARRARDDAHPLVRETWAAMDEVYGLGVIETPLQPSPWLSALAGPGAGSVALKLECAQATGSFKARGAAHKLLSLPPDRLAAGVITSSTGNHAMGVMHATAALAAAGRPVALTVYVPSSLAPAKAGRLVDAAARCGAAVRTVGIDCVEAEAAARAAAAAGGAVYVSPYNDVAVAGGQGTLAVELLMARPPGKLDAVFVPVGGGGLISGVAALLKSMDPSITVIGCQPAASDVMRRSVEAGRVVAMEWAVTLSDATAGGIEEGSITLEACSRFVDEFVIVSEREIAAAMVGVQGHHGLAVEGAAGVAVAAYAKKAREMAGKHAVVVVCGGNVAAETMDRAYALAAAPAAAG